MPFETNVFVNCPFDEDYAPILQAILFCTTYLGLSPQIASARVDGADNRLERIVGLIETSKYAIHDLVRCQAREAGEMFRLNMPFELGIDYACRRFCGHPRSQKRILVLEAERYRFQAALSDLAGCDIEAHHDDFEVAVRRVRNWIAQDFPDVPGPNHVLNAYVAFQEWHYERQLARGFSDDDIRDYPTAELLAAMQEWTAQNIRM